MPPTARLRVLLVATAKTDLGFDRAMRPPNLGLCSIAAHLDRSSCDVRVLDLVVAGFRPEARFRRELRRYRPDIVGLSCMTFQYSTAVALAATVKATLPGATVVLGGYHPTVAAAEILATESDMRHVDYLVRGEGEVAFAQLVAAIAGKTPVADISGLSYLDRGSPVHTPAAAPLDLAKVSLPDRAARILTKGFYLFGFPADVIETSRGCPHRCDFCSIRRMYGSTYRTYATDRILDDLRDCRARGAKAIFVADDNVALKGERYKNLCGAIADAGLNDLGFFVQAGVQGLSRTPGLVPAMRRGGVRIVFLGIENVSPDIRAGLDKGHQFANDDVAGVVSRLKAEGIVTIGGFIIGNPDDTEESIRANYDYAVRLGIDVGLFFILTPFPGTETREKLLAQGLVTRPHDYDQYTCFRACVRTHTLSSERLFALRERLGFHYPFDAGSVWRLARMVPPAFIVRKAAEHIVREPMELVGYVRGLLSRRA